MKVQLYMVKGWDVGLLDTKPPKYAPHIHQYKIILCIIFNNAGGRL